MLQSSSTKVTRHSPGPGRTSRQALGHVVGSKAVEPSISHDRDDESIEAKTRWFRSLSAEERMQVFDEMTEMMLAINPGVAEAGRVQSSSGRVRVLRAP